MTCGGEPPALAPTAVCEEANGVGYFVEDAPLKDESVDVTGAQGEAPLLPRCQAKRSLEGRPT